MADQATFFQRFSSQNVRRDSYDLMATYISLLSPPWAKTFVGLATVSHAYRPLGIKLL